MTESGRRETAPDPFALWRQTYEMAEEAWTKAFEQTSGTDAFAASLGKSLDSFLGFQKLMRDNMQLQLETLNLPTRQDLARLGELIVNLENKIDDLDDRLDEIADDVARLRRERTADNPNGPQSRGSEARSGAGSRGRGRARGGRSGAEARPTGQED